MCLGLGRRGVCLGLRRRGEGCVLRAWSSGDNRVLMEPWGGVRSIICIKAWGGGNHAFQGLGRR